MVSVKVLDLLQMFLLQSLRLTTGWGNPAANLLLCTAQVHGEEMIGLSGAKILKFQTLNQPQKLLKQPLVREGHVWTIATAMLYLLLLLTLRMYGEIVERNRILCWMKVIGAILVSLAILPELLLGR